MPVPVRKYDIYSKRSQARIVGHGCKTYEAMINYCKFMKDCEIRLTPEGSENMFIGLPGPIGDPNNVVDMTEHNANMARKSLVFAGDPSHLKEGERKIIMLRDTDLTYPDLWVAVYVQGDANDHKLFAQMFGRAACYRAETPEEADLVVFTGGVDVDPRLYGARPHFSTEGGNKARDDEDMNLFLKCKAKGIPMFGVCRGAQFLHVMMGGKLWQDMDNHQKPHPMTDVRTGEVLTNISSVHHQSVVFEEGLGMQIIAIARTSTRKVKYKGGQSFEATHDTVTIPDIEAFWYRDACIFGVQGHPEYSNYHTYTQWCLAQINDLIICNPDLYWEDKKRMRIRPELMEENEWENNKKMVEAIEAQGLVKVPKVKAEKKAKEKQVKLTTTVEVK